MNRQDALQKLAALEAETKALRQIIEAPEVPEVPEVPAIPKRWRPRSGDSYSQVLANGEVRGFTVELSNKEYEHGNCFKTIAQAEIAAKAVGQTLRICAAAFAVDPDAGVFDRENRRWTVILFTGSNTWHPYQSSHPDSARPIYVYNYRQAELMAAILNAEGT